jgi:hypothetical protein
VDRAAADRLEQKLSEAVFECRTWYCEHRPFRSTAARDRHEEYGNHIHPEEVPID